MPYSSFSKEQKWLIRMIAVIFLIAFVVPHFSDQLYDEEKKEFYQYVFYGWENFNFLIFFVFAVAVILLSLSRFIAVRLFVIGFLQILMIPAFLLVLIGDQSHLDNPQMTHYIGFYLSYAGVLLAMTYGFIHLRDSYPTYKRMLKEYKKDDEDVLDSF